MPVDPVPSTADSGTAIVKTVGNCSNLPAAGTWESITPFKGAAAVAVDPFDPAVVWLNGGKGGVWKSSDCGSTWAEVSTGRNRAAIENGYIVSIAIDPLVQGVMYVVTIYGSGGVWKTTNGGVDWDQLIPTSPVSLNAMNNIAIDPTNHLHLIVGMHADCLAPYAPTCEAETVNGGASWTFIKSPNGKNAPGTTGDWEEGSNIWIRDASTWLYGGLHLWITRDHGVTWTNLDPDPASAFSFSGDHTHTITRGADGTEYVGCGTGIVSSADGWKTWTLIPNTGRIVGMVHGNGHFYASDQWSTKYLTASDADPMHWSVFPPPASLPAAEGAAFLDYDSAHHVLYSSNGDSGLFRTVTP